MTYQLDREYFQKLSKMDPSEVCRSAICSWRHDQGCFELDVWGHLYAVYPKRFEIAACDPASPPVNTAISLSTIFYLLKAKEVLLKKEWISEKDIPSGAQFFRGPHAIPTDSIARAFSDDIEGFKEACVSLGGEKVEFGDAAYSFRFFPRVPVAVVLWARSEEFEAESKMLFDRSIGDHLPLDVIFAISVEICSRITNTAGVETQYLI